MSYLMNEVGVVSPKDTLLGYLHGFWITRAIQMAAEEGIADLLADGPKSTNVLATATGTHEPSLYRLLRALSSISIFSEVQPGYFQQTELSTYLQSDQPGSLRNIARTWGDPALLRAVEALPYSLHTGEAAFEYMNGVSLWPYLDTHPETAQIFHQGMTSFSESVNFPVASSYNFSHFQTIIDVGGGLGSLLSTILKMYPTVQGILFDRDEVIQRAREHIEIEVKARCILVSGDFFTSVPSGANVYILKQVMHDYDDPTCIRILKNCRQAMNAGDRILIIERVIKSGEGDALNKFFDLHMLAMLAGLERTEAQFDHLYEASGFALTEVIVTASPSSIVEGMAV